eukprot:432071_1
MSLQYGSWTLQQTNKYKTTRQWSYNCFISVLNHWCRKEQINKERVDVQNILDVIIKFCENDIIWFIFTEDGIFGWNLSPNKTKNNRMYFGKLLKSYLNSRYHVDHSSNTIYRFTEIKHIKTLIEHCRFSNINNTNQLKFETLGYVPRNTDIYGQPSFKQICIFNNQQLFMIESDQNNSIFTGHTTRNLQFVNFDLRTNTLSNNTISYGKYTNNTPISMFRQIKNEYILGLGWPKWNNDQCFVFKPNEYENKFESIKWNAANIKDKLFEYDGAYFSEYYR